jgi:hypothetical protein
LSAKVTWPIFLDLYCTFVGGQVEKAQLIRFWIKFFDVLQAGFCHEKDYMELLEEMIRGKSLHQSNETTKMFAQMY